MARLTGEVRDFGFLGWPERHAQLHYVPEGPAVAESLSFLLSESPVPVALTQPGNGFDFFLVGSDAVSPPRRVSFRVRWLDAEGGFTREDWWRDVWVPDSWDGPLAPLLAQSAGASQMSVIWQASEPSELEAPIGAVWVNTVTGDVRRRDA